MNSIIFLCASAFFFNTFAHDSSTTKESTFVRKKVKKNKPKVEKKISTHKILSSNDKIIPVSKNAHLEDCVSVVIYTTEDPIVLTKKDFERDSINGAEQTKSDIIMQHIMAHHARVMYKMEASEEMMEKYLQNIMDQHGLTRDQIKIMFEQAGYTLQEGIEQLKMMYLIDNLLNYKIKSRLIISEEAIQKYYDENPEYTIATYTMQTGFIKSNDITPEQISDWSKIKNNFNNIEWSDSYTLDDEDISEDRAFIKNLGLYEISDLEEVVEGFEIIRLLKKREAVLKKMEDRHKIILEKLRAPMFEKMLKEYKKELLSEYEVVDIH